MTAPALTSFQQVQADVLARMPTPAPEWKLLTREDARDEYEHQHIALWELHFDDTWHRYFVNAGVNADSDGNAQLVFQLCEHNLPHQAHSFDEFGTRNAVGSTWSEFTQKFAVYLEDVCNIHRNSRSEWEFARAKLQLAGINAYHVAEDETPTDLPPLPLSIVPTFQQRIHDVAGLYDAWEDANTASTNQDYNRTRLWFRTWLGYAWYRATQQTHVTSLEVLQEALGVGSRNIVGYDQIMRWIIEPLEWWADAGMNAWRIAAAPKATVQQLLSDFNLFQVDSSGNPQEAIRGVVTAPDWTAYGNAQYEAARDWTPPPPPSDPPANNDGQSGC